MKITEELLEAMILQELISTMSGKDQENRVSLQYRTGPFFRLVQAAFENLDRLEDGFFLIYSIITSFEISLISNIKVFIL